LIWFQLDELHLRLTLSKFQQTGRDMGHQPIIIVALWSWER
jgi:hypothetical protein